MTVQYQGVWSLQSAAQLQSTQRWVTDPVFDYTTLLLQADDAANGSQNNTFLDSSSNSFAITRNGNTTQGSFTPFSQSPGRWGNFFDGADDFLQRTSPATGLINWTSTNWTLEYWIYANAFGQGANTESNIIGNATDGGATAYWSFGPISTGAVRWYYFTGASPTITTTTTLATGRWYHLAFVNNGGNLAIYIDGVSSATGTIIGTPQFSSGTPFTIGKITGSSFNGYISNLRITQSAVYTANFTPSSIPLSPISGTQLMTCQSNQFIDNSTSPVVFTPSGTPSVQAFSPFAPQFQWTPSVIGGSGYFDGTGDYLQTPATGQFAPTGNWTISLWFYPTALASTQDLIGNYTANTGADWTWVVNSNGSIDFYLAGASVITMSAAAGTIRLNQWHFISVSRSTNTVTAFVNGSQVATASYSQTLGSASKAQYVGSRFGSFVCTGYISDVRMVDGQVVTSVPTTPTTTTTGSVTASNTKLLLNFTNAGIYDGTMKNNLETVGNAQVSTAVVKYGSGSMYFDGTGDYLTAPNLGGQFDFRTGDFTIEFWLYAPSGIASFADTIISKGPPGVVDFTSWSIQGNGSGGNFDFYGPFSTIYFSTTSTPWTTGWAHVAVSRSGSISRMFVNGVQQGASYTTLQDFLAGGPLIVGSGYYDPAGRSMNGYLDDVRITKGIARYTQNFIPPSVALPRQ